MGYLVSLGPKQRSELLSMANAEDPVRGGIGWIGERDSQYWADPPGVQHERCWIQIRTEHTPLGIRGDHLYLPQLAHRDVRRAYPQLVAAQRNPVPTHPPQHDAGQRHCQQVWQPGLYPRVPHMDLSRQQRRQAETQRPPPQRYGETLSEHRHDVGRVLAGGFTIGHQTEGSLARRVPVSPRSPADPAGS